MPGTPIRLNEMNRFVDLGESGCQAPPRNVRTGSGRKGGGLWQCCGDVIRRRQEIQCDLVDIELLEFEVHGVSLIYFKDDNVDNGNDNGLGLGLGRRCGVHGESLSALIGVWCAAKIVATNQKEDVHGSGAV